MRKGQNFKTVHTVPKWLRPKRNEQEYDNTQMDNKLMQKDAFTLIAPLLKYATILYSAQSLFRRIQFQNTGNCSP